MSNDGERPEIPMELGLRVDILDNEGIWNTGRIVDVSRDDDDMVEVKYDGWGDEYNEWVSLAERRLAPLHMFTMVKKCWAKLTKWPWWPAFVVLRAPTCKTAAAALEQETKLYVEFFDSYDVEKRSRCWMQKKNIVSFQEGFDERASKNIGKNFPLFVEGTQRAIAGGSPVLFTGHGTLPIEFSSKYAAPLFQKKLDLVDNDEERWYDAYRVFSDRYKVLYGYEYAVDSVSKVLAVRNAKTGSGKAASGKRVQRDDNDEEDEDEDDDVEIIEDVVAKNNVKKSVKTAPAPARRARDYPAKQPPQSVDDDDMEDAEESEEKEEEPEEDAASDEDDEEEEEDDEEDEDPESPNGRRSARLTKKRKQEEEDTLAARRTTRARRTKVLDQLVGSSRAATAMSRRPASSPTPSSTSTASNSTTGVKSSFASASRRRRIYDEDDEGVEVVDLISSSRSVSPVKQVKRTMRALEQLVNAPLSRQTEKKTEPAMLSAKHEESKSEVDKVEPEPDLEPSPTPHQSLSSTSRRKSTSPRLKNGDGALFTTTSVNQGKAAIKTESPARADGLFRHWIGLGPSEDGTTRRNWSIQSWLMNGIRNKLSSEGKLNQ